MTAGQLVTLRVFRWDPESDQPPRYQSYTVPAHPRMVVGEALEHIFTHLDGTLAFRYECRTRQCGSCVVQVDGRPTLFCMERVGKRRTLTVEPLGRLPIIKDLVTDRGPLLDPLYALAPFAPAAEEAGWAPVSASALTEVKRAEECAECGLCTAVCPAYASGDFAGPMYFNKVFRHASDPRDGADRLREAVAGHLFDCNTCYRCEAICPHEIPLRTREIRSLQGMAVAARLDGRR